jgi:hypothetical protein
MPKEDWKVNTVERIFSDAGHWPWQQGDIVSVLDVACGLSLKSKYIDAQIRVGVDLFEEYFNHIEADVPYVLIKYDVRKLSEIFPPKSFDLVIGLDIIEHLEKEESLSMIQQCETIARKGVIFETPKGFIPQNIDILGYGGHEFQTHRCGWEVAELEGLGYTVVVRTYTMSNAKRHTELETNSEVELIDAIKILA